MKVRSSKIVLVVTLLVCGYLAYWLANRDFFPSTVPNARLSVDLDQPLNEYELFRIVEAMADAAGYDHYYGRGLEGNKGGKNREGRLDLHDWFVGPGIRQGKWNYAINVAWNHYFEEVDYFRFVFYNSSTEPFTLKEWKMFAQWRAKIQQAFPLARVTIIRHPGRWTETQNLIEFSKATGLKLTEKQLARLAEVESRQEIN